MIEAEGQRLTMSLDARQAMKGSVMRFRMVSGLSCACLLLMVSSLALADEKLNGPTCERQLEWSQQQNANGTSRANQLDIEKAALQVELTRAHKMNALFVKQIQDLKAQAEKAVKATEPEKPKEPKE